MLDRKDVPWQSVKLRKNTREFLSQLARGTFDERIRYIVLFGSEARGEARMMSDVDIAVVSDEPMGSKDKVMVVYGNVEEKVELAVDYRLVSISTTSLDCDNFKRVQYHIKREGLIVYER